MEIRSISDSITVTATDLDIRSLTEVSDSIQIFANDGTDNVAVRADNEGRLEIRSISDSVTVTATDLDIRDLSEASDSILIYGNDGSNNVVIKTDADGRLEIASISEPITAITTPDFSEANFTNVQTGDSFTPLSYVDTATQQVYTFFVYNKGTNSADVRLDVSADQNTFFTDVTARTISAGATDTFVAKTFMRYTRLAYKATTAGQQTTLDIFFQTQTS
ncbi:hypothetical protein JOC37_000660 [Desulfohalotomaculum tongense]|uniref:DUF6385 domain-containing protein n=1 Tax=Desulforadius tongensis TaxID=1216062 RepID=UPI0019587BC8|nr:DUF6385 domain-containing protein [Desulforadius tongensis]MBM7854287.1 hypothetical protein [Desulforadius tongensis]